MLTFTEFSQTFTIFCTFLILLIYGFNFLLRESTYVVFVLNSRRALATGSRTLSRKKKLLKCLRNVVLQSKFHQNSAFAFR